MVPIIFQIIETNIEFSSLEILLSLVQLPRQRRSGQKEDSVVSLETAGSWEKPAFKGQRAPRAQGSSSCTEDIPPVH